MILALGVCCFSFLLLTFVLTSAVERYVFLQTCLPLRGSDCTMIENRVNACEVVARTVFTILLEHCALARKVLTKPFEHIQLQAASNRLQAESSRLQATGYKLQATGCKPQATGCSYRLQAPYLGFSPTIILSWGLTLSSWPPNASTVCAHFNPCWC